MKDENKEAPERSSPSGKIVYKTIFKEGEEELHVTVASKPFVSFASYVSLSEIVRKPDKVAVGTKQSGRGPASVAL